MATGRFVSYLRVSTARQGRSGLGLEAQQKAVADYLNGGRWQLVAEFVEVESGKVNTRPQLDAALGACRLYKATLVVSRLDRLSRDASFLLKLQRDGVDFVAVDMPEANSFTVGMMAVIAQHEREMISARTKAALAAAKRRGVVLGTPANLTNRARHKGTKVSAEVRSVAADQRAVDLAGIVRPLRDRGASLREIARELDAQEIPTPRGGTWTADAVRRVLLRLDAEG